MTLPAAVSATEKKNSGTGPDSRHMQFYGIDWLATAAGLSGVYLLGNRNRIGFLVMMVASLSWMTVGFMIGSIALMLGSLVFFSLHVRGFLAWRRDDRNAIDASQVRVAK